MSRSGEGMELPLRACSTGETNEPPALIREDIHKMDIVYTHEDSRVENTSRTQHP
jgi:hypothetical protein